MSNRQPTSPDAPPEPSRYPVLWPMQTRWSDNDHNGHVDSVTYFSYFVSAVEQWLVDATGVDIRELDAIGVMAESSTHFFGELSFPDRLRVGVSVTRLGRTSVGYSLAMFKQGPDETLEPVATCRFVHVYVDAVSRKPTRIPEQVRKVATRIVVPLP